MTRIDMYGTRSDILRVLGDAELQSELKYARVGYQESTQPKIFNKALDIPEMGIANHGWVLREDRWYILDSSSDFVVDEVTRHARTTRYFLGARLNPDAVLIIPGGLLSSRGIVQGTINPVSPSEKALSVFRGVKKSLQKTFVVSGDVLVGPEALLLYQNGMRLATSLHSFPDSDFKLEME